MFRTIPILKTFGISIILATTSCKEDPPKSLEVKESTTPRDITLIQEIATDSTIQVVRFSMKDDMGF